MFKKKEKENIRAKLINKQGEVIRELNGTEGIHVYTPNISS